MSVPLSFSQLLFSMGLISNVCGILCLVPYLLSILSEDQKRCFSGRPGYNYVLKKETSRIQI